MRALFVHDHVFHVAPDATVYSPGRLPYSTFRRYIDIFGELEVLARSRELGANAQWLNEASGPSVSFAFDHPYRGPADLIMSGREAVASVMRKVMQADAVIARLPSELGQVAVRCCIRERRPFAIEVVGCAFDAYWNYGSVFAKAYAPLMYQRMRSAVVAAPFALYVTREFLQRRYPCRGVTAAVSDVALSENSKDVLARRLAAIVSGERISLGFIGSLRSRYKGLDTALRALRALRHEGKAVELRVLGDGDQAPWRKLAEQIGVQDLVIFEGVLPSGDPVSQWLDSIDVFIQPSRQEGLPRSLIEAMSRGCPAIGSTAGGIPELLPADCMHAPDDWRMLTQRIVEIGWNVPKRRALAERNWLESRRYDRERLAGEWQEFFFKFAEYVKRGRHRS